MFSEDFLNELYEAIEEGERQLRADAPGVAPDWLTPAKALYAIIDDHGLCDKCGYDRKGVTDHASTCGRRG